MQRAEETLRKAARGDESAFADIVREHQAMIFSLAHHFLHDRALAEELAQEVFLELYQNFAAIQSPVHLKFWLRKVTSHRCIDLARRHQTRPQVSLDALPEIEELEDSPPLSDPMLSRRLEQLVSALPETPRLIVILRYQEDLEPMEIAEVLEMPVNTVKSHLRRSLALLREKLNRCLGGVLV